MHRSLHPIVLLLALGCAGKGTDSGLQPTISSQNTDTGTTGNTPTGSTTGTTSTGTTATSVAGTDYCTPWPAATGATVSATPSDNLQALIDGLATGDTLSLASGTYPLAAPLVLATEGITLRSATGNRDDVLLDGEGVATALVEIVGDHISVVSMTLTNALDDGVRIEATVQDVLGATLYDLVLRDNPQYGVWSDDNGGFFADLATVACSHISLTDTGRANVRNSCLTAGIEAQRVQGWIVRDNTVEGYWCDSGGSPGAIRFWKGSRDTEVVRNRVFDSRRGIVFGLGTTLIVRTYSDDPCGGERAQHFGGRIVNNFVGAEHPGLFGADLPPDDGIALESSCDTLVLHNSVRHLQLPLTGSIVHRYPLTSGTVANNLSSAAAVRLDSSAATAEPNLELVVDAGFEHAPSGDLHLSAFDVSAIDLADPAWSTEVPEDIDGQPRDATPDFGADERFGIVL